MDSLKSAPRLPVLQKCNPKCQIETLELDDNAAVSQYYNVNSIPMTIVIGKNGKKLGERVGSMDEEDLINLINSSK